MYSNILKAMVVAPLAAAPFAEQADSAPGEQKGDWLVRAGFSQVNPKSQNLDLSDEDGNAYLDVDSDISFTFDVTYMFTNHFGVELLAAWPFTHGIDGRSGGDKERIGYTDHLPPTLSDVWRPRSADAGFQPYVGAGVNYTMFSGEELKGDPSGGGGRGPIDAAVEGAQDLWTYRMERALARHGMTTLYGREKAAKELTGVVSRIGDPVRRELAFRLLAERTGVPESTLRSEARAPRTPGGARAGRPDASDAWLEAERHVLRATLEDGALWDRVELWYPPDRFRDAGLRFVATALSDLRRRGESVTREGLLSVLADKDEAVRALMALEPSADSRQRAEAHLARLAREENVRRALAQNDLEAVIRARKDSPAVSP